MKKRAWCLGFALCMMLTGCGPKTTQVTPAPSPSDVLETTAPTLEPTVSPEPTPEPPEDVKEYVLSWLDKILEEEEIFVCFWIHPGSGPTPANWSTAENGAAVRELFENLNWDSAKLATEAEEEAAYEEMWAVPGGYTVTVSDRDFGGGNSIRCGLNRGTIYVVGNNDSFCFRVDGAEKLCQQLTDMEPSVYVNMGRVRVPAQKTPEDTVKLYLETAMERTKKCGHITDYALRAYEVTSFSEGEPPESIAYTATYAFKPAHPELAYWKDAPFDDDGWVETSIEEYTEILGYDEQDGCYGMY